MKNENEIVAQIRELENRLKDLDLQLKIVLPGTYGEHRLSKERDMTLNAIESENETERLFIVAWHCMLNAKNMQQSDIDAGNKLFERLTAPKP
jgi:hypothetical protein